MKSINQKLSEGKKIIVAATVGSYEEACASMRNGADCLLFYHTAALGIPTVAGLMPYGNTSEIVLEMLRKIRLDELDILKYVGLCGSEPFKRKKKLLEEIRSFGVDGIQNFPTIGMADGIFRYNMESVQFGFKTEVGMIREAKNLGLSVLPYVFNPSEALLMLASGADTIIYHLGYMSIKKGQVSSAVDTYLMRILSFEKIVRQNWPNTKILVYSPSETLLKKLYPIIFSEVKINGIFTFLHDGSI